MYIIFHVMTSQEVDETDLAISDKNGTKAIAGVESIKFQDEALRLTKVASFWRHD